MWLFTACLLSASRPESFYDKDGEEKGGMAAGQDVNSNEVASKEGEAESTKMPLHHRLSSTQVILYAKLC